MDYQFKILSKNVSERDWLNYVLHQSSHSLQDLHQQGLGGMRVSEDLQTKLELNTRKRF